MAFFDKLTDAAAKVTDVANDAVETTKIKTKIYSQKKDIDGALASLGKIFYDKAKGGECLPPEAMEVVNQLDVLYRDLEELEKQL